MVGAGPRAVWRFEVGEVGVGRIGIEARETGGTPQEFIGLDGARPVDHLGENRSPPRTQ